MNRLLNLALSAIVGDLLKAKVREGSIKALKAYLMAIKGLRFGVMGLVALGVTASILVSGLVLMIIGLVGLFTLNSNSFSISVLVIGALMTLATGIGFALLFSQRRWLELSKSYELMDAVLAPWPGSLPPNPVDVFKGNPIPVEEEVTVARPSEPPRTWVVEERREFEREPAGLEPQFAR